MMAEERLQKIIARSGLCSRRDADRMVADGRVTVDGRVAEPGETVDAATARIRVDGKPLRAPEAPRYLLLYKPRGVMTTCDDPEERRTVVDIVRPIIRERVYPVGRLDYHSEGLLILTNDGDLAARVAHPRYGLVREYLVKIRGDLSEAELRKLMAGTTIEGRRVRPRQVRRATRGRASTVSWWRVEVTEGRTHEVRELFFRAGHHVQRLRRTAIGPLRDDSLKPGEFRTISEAELAALRGEAPQRRPQQRRPRAAAASGRSGPGAASSGRSSRKR
jgi:pseudouridine synthase